MLLVPGALLLVLQAYGLSAPPVKGVKSSQAIPGYHYRVIEYSEAYSRYKALLNSKLNDHTKASRLLELVYGSFVHAAENYDAKIYDNFFYCLYDKLVRMSSRGKMYLPLMDAAFLWKRGGGHCRQAVQIFNHLALGLNLRTRTWVNKDHVVGEVQLDQQKWVTFDADYGVLWDRSFDQLRQPESYAQLVEQYQRKGWTHSYAERLAQLFIAPEAPWHLDELDRTELLILWKRSRLFSFLAPALASLLGLLMLVRTRRG